MELKNPFLEKKLSLDKKETYNLIHNDLGNQNYKGN